jgi:sugar phosphate permease
MRQPPWIFYGWLIVACTVLVLALSSGTRMSFGIALVPLSEQFGWTRATLSTIVLISGIVTGLLQPVMGLLVDRLGPRRLLAGGVTLLGVSVWWLTVATTVWQFGLAYGLLGGVGLAATQQVVGSTLVANWFVRHRGLALSVVGSAAAMGWMIVVPANMFLERAYGWMTMYRTLAAALLIGILPVVWTVVRTRPEDMGLRPYGEALPGEPVATGADGAAAGVTLRQALRALGTWKLVYLGFA